MYPPIIEFEIVITALGYVIFLYAVFIFLLLIDYYFLIVVIGTHCEAEIGNFLSGEVDVEHFRVSVTFKKIVSNIGNNTFGSGLKLGIISYSESFDDYTIGRAYGYIVVVD